MTHGHVIPLLGDPDMQDELEPIPLKFVQEAAEFTPVFGAWQTYVFSGVASETAPFQLLPADLRRRRVLIRANSPQENALTAFGQVTAPGAGATIVSIAAGSLVQGPYSVQWEVGLSGTLAAGDANNFRISGPGPNFPQLTSVNPPAAGTYPQDSFFAVIPPSPGGAVKIVAVGAGTAGSVYSAQFTLTPLVNTYGFALVGALGQVSNGQGGRLYPGQQWELKNHGPLWMAGDGLTPLVVTMLVERDQE